jgi:hypothetical protein
MKILSQDDVTSSVMFMTAKFQDCVSKVEKSTALILEMEIAVKKMNAYCDSLKQDHSSLKKDFSDFISSSSSDSSKKDASVSSSLLEIGKIVGTFSKDADSIRQEVQVLKDGLSKSIQNQNSFVQSGTKAIESVKADVEDVKTTFLNTLQKLEEKDIANKGAHTDLKNFVTNLANDLISAKGTLREFVGSTSSFATELAAHKESTAKNLELIGQEFTHYIEQKLSELPKPSLAPTISPEEAKAQIQKQVEPASLDARNANLRSANNEQKITLLEKKLENLQLLLNKLQLSQ